MPNRKVLEDIIYDRIDLVREHIKLPTLDLGQVFLLLTSIEELVSQMALPEQKNKEQQCTTLKTTSSS